VLLLLWVFCLNIIYYISKKLNKSIVIIGIIYVNL